MQLSLPDLFVMSFGGFRNKASRERESEEPRFLGEVTGMAPEEAFPHLSAAHPWCRTSRPQVGSKVSLNTIACNIPFCLFGLALLEDSPKIRHSLSFDPPPASDLSA